MKILVFYEHDQHFCKGHKTDNP